MITNISPMSIQFKAECIVPTELPFRHRAAMVAVALAVATICNASGSAFFGDVAGNQPFSGYGIAPGGGVNNAIAQGFLMTQTLSLSSVDLILQNFQPAAGSNLALSIYSDAGNKPGVDLYDLSTNISIPTSGSPAQVTFSGSGSFTLNSGTTYWLNLYATNPSSPTGTSVQWTGALSPGFTQVNPSGSSASDVGQLRSIGNGNSFSGTPSTSELRTAFQLNSVPEPSGLVLLALGGALITRRHRPYSRPNALEG